MSHGEHKLSPTAEGSFSKTPFSHILVFLMEKQRSGTLEVDAREQSASIYFRDGMPAKVRTSVPGRGLGRVLVGFNIVPKAALDRAEERIARHGGLLGHTLIEQGALDMPALVRGLREQMLLKINDVFGMTGGNYAFYEKVNSLVGFGPDEIFQLDTFPVLMSGLRTYAERFDFGPVLQSLETKWISVGEVEAMRRFRFNQAEKALVTELLDGPVRYEHLLGGGAHDPKVVRYTVYVLLITKQLTAAAAGPADGTHSDSKSQVTRLDSIPPDAAIESADPEIAARKERIRSTAGEISSQNYFEMLRLPFGADSEEVRKAYFRLAKEFHPDKVPASVAAGLRETLHYVFMNLSEAHTTLTDPDLREEYISTIREGQGRTSMAPEPAGGRDEVKDALEAESLFQKALVFSRRDQLDKANDLVDRARMLCPDEGEYLALWAHIQGRLRPTAENVDELVDLLRKAAERCPNSERVLLSLAQMLKRTNRINEARTYFQKVLDMKPHNVEAARELRFIEMRFGKEEEAAKKKGLFSKLFR